MRTLRSVKWLLILSVVCITSPGLANDSIDAAVNRLSTIERFAFGGVGFAGVTSKGEIDFKLVLAQPRLTALNAFEKLYTIGNPQGKSYALAGLKKLVPQRFTELAKASEKSPDVVEVMRGCIVSHEPLHDVAKQIAQGKFRF